MHRDHQKRRRALAVGAAVGIAMALGAGPLGSAEALGDCYPMAGLGGVCILVSETTPDVSVVAAVIDSELLNSGVTGGYVELDCQDGTYVAEAGGGVALGPEDVPLDIAQPTGIPC